METRSINDGQLRSFIGQLGIGEGKLGKDHWGDIFHEQDGQAVTQAGASEKTDCVQHLKDQLRTIYKTAQGELGWDDPNNCPLDLELICGAEGGRDCVLPQAVCLHQSPGVGGPQEEREDHPTPVGGHEQGRTKCPNVRAR